MAKRRRRNRFAARSTVKLFGGTIRFNIEGKGVEEWLDRQRDFKSKADNMSPLMASFGQYMLGSVQRNFKAEGRPAWEPLAKSTILDRISQGFGPGPILERTGTMRRGFRANTGPTFMNIVNRVDYYDFHQQDKRKGKKIPRRIMVILQDRDKGEFTRLINRFFGA